MSSVNNGSAISAQAVATESMRGQGWGVNINRDEFERAQARDYAKGFAFEELDVNNDSFINEYDVDESERRYVRRGPDDGGIGNGSDSGQHEHDMAFAGDGGAANRKSDMRSDSRQNNGAIEGGGEDNGSQSNDNGSGEKAVNQQGGGSTMVPVSNKGSERRDSGWHTGPGGIQVNYSKFGNGHENPNELIPEGTTHMFVVSSSGGHKKDKYEPHNGVTEGHFNMSGNEMNYLGNVGSFDKSAALYEVNGKKSFNFKGQNECELVFLKIPPGKTLRIDNPGLAGAKDPMIGGDRDIKCPTSSSFAAYFEDEGGMGNRDIVLAKSYLGFPGSDNAAYFLSSGQNINLGGNGALALLSLVNK